ncbi:Uncharacterised protein [Cedecea neteri]|uniref:Uncharacterized protein n=1 Tax=Cedecea neteri TaxID=158822 RepID=A0A2X2V3R1_9ENTR|nr:Uncharacterised protein [Cedecea neteri]
MGSGSSDGAGDAGRPLKTLRPRRLAVRLVRRGRLRIACPPGDTSLKTSDPTLQKIVSQFRGGI